MKAVAWYVCHVDILSVGDVMTNVFDVARYVLTKMRSANRTHLQILVYYVHVWSLVLHGKSMINDRFVCTPKGPLCHALEQYIQLTCSNFDIVSCNSFCIGDELYLDNEKTDLIDSVLELYSEFSVQDLIEHVLSEKPVYKTKFMNEIKKKAAKKYYSKSVTYS